MKIYISHSTSYDFVNELYLPIRNSELNKIHEFILPHEDIENQYNSKDLFKSGSVDFVIAEVSTPSHRVGIELGWAEMCDVPVVCIYKEGSSHSKSLTAVSKKFLMYTDSENMIQDLEGLLRQY
jgi:membrane-bound lytic murein transglycosylase MltF